MHERQSRSVFQEGFAQQGEAFRVAFELFVLNLAGNQQGLNNMKKMLPLLILVFSAAVFAQSDLPEIGRLTDIKDKTKVYIVADAYNLKWILKSFDKQKTLVRVDKPDDADFFLEFKTIASGEYQSVYSSMRYETGQLDAYYLRDKKKVVAWSDSAKSGLNMPSIQLIKRFLKEFAK